MILNLRDFRRIHRHSALNFLTFLVLSLGALMLVDHIHAFNEDLADGRKSFDDLAGLALVIAREYFNCIAFLDMHGN